MKFAFKTVQIGLLLQFILHTDRMFEQPYSLHTYEKRSALSFNATIFIWSPYSLTHSLTHLTILNFVHTVARLTLNKARVYRAHICVSALFICIFITLRPSHFFHHLSLFSYINISRVYISRALLTYIPCSGSENKTPIQS